MIATELHTAHIVVNDNLTQCCGGEKWPFLLRSRSTKGILCCTYFLVWTSPNFYRCQNKEELSHRSGWQTQHIIKIHVTWMYISKHRTPYIFCICHIVTHNLMSTDIRSVSYLSSDYLQNDRHLGVRSCPLNIKAICSWDRHLHYSDWFKISQIFELLHVVDRVKNVCRDGPEQDSWRHSGVCHSGIRKFWGSAVDCLSDKDRCLHSWSLKERQKC